LDVKFYDEVLPGFAAKVEPFIGHVQNVPTATARLSHPAIAAFLYDNAKAQVAEVTARAKP